MGDTVSKKDFQNIRLRGGSWALSHRTSRELVSWSRGPPHGQAQGLEGQTLQQESPHDGWAASLSFLIDEDTCAD